MGTPADTASLAAAIEQSHRALRAILNGDPTLYEALFAERDDITLGNPFGPYARGRAAVSKTLAGAAAKYRDGEVVGVDPVATYANGNIACVVEVEHDRAKVGAGNEPAEFHVRVTSVYERLKGQWRSGAPPRRSHHDSAPGGVGAGPGWLPGTPNQLSG